MKLAPGKILSSLTAILTALALTVSSAAESSYISSYENSGGSETAADIGGFILPTDGLKKIEPVILTDEEAEKIAETVKEDYIRCGELDENGNPTYRSSRKEDAYTDLISVYNFSTDYYYTQLTSAQKDFYDGLNNVCDTFMKSNVELSDIYFTVGVPYSYTEMDFDTAWHIYQLFYYSHPEYYFLSQGVSYGGNRIYPKIIKDFKSSDTRATYQSAIASVTESWLEDILDAPTDLEKEEVIYTKLCNTIDYVQSDRDQSLAGALVDQKCVCNGYAMAMCYFCNAAGIDCITVTSENHAWNIIKLYGKWYHVDVTWMDQNGYIWEAYINKSYENIRSGDGSDGAHIIDDEDYSGIVTLPDCPDDFTTAELTSISILTMPKTEYFVGDKLDVSGGVIKALYSDSTTNNISMTSGMITGFDTSTVGIKTLTVTFQGLTTTYTITVKAVEVTGISILKMPKTEYKIGNALDVSNGTLKVSYNNGTFKTISITPDMVSGFDSSAAADLTLTVSYGGKVITYDITVSERVPVSMSLVKPTKTDYFAGDELDLTGGSITVKYDDGTSETFDLEYSMISEYDPEATGSQTITVTFGGLTKYFIVKVTAVMPESLAISALPKTQYFLEDELDLTDGLLSVKYNNGDSATIKMTDSRVTVSGFSSSAAGTKTVTVSVFGLSVKFSVTISIDPENAPVTVNGIGYETLTDALAQNKTGDLKIIIYKNITEAKAITIPKTNTYVSITTAPGVTLTLGTPTITANCELVLDAAIASSKANAKTLTIKSAADKKVTINRIETSLPLTLSGAKTTDFILNTNSALNVLSAASVNVEIASGTAVVLNAGKFTPTTLSGAGKLNVYGASTVTIANVVSADITLNQYEKTSGKNTTILLPKLTVGKIGKMNLTVNDPIGELADISGKTVVYLSKADAVANLENLITIANTANDKKLSAVQYKKEVRAEYLDAITVSDGSNSKNYSSFEKAFESMTNASRNYTITLNESTSASKITLPKTVASLTINGAGNTLKFVGMASFAPKYAFSLENITIISEDNKGNAAAFTINSSTGNTTVDGLIFSGKSLTIKGGSGNNLTLGKCSGINTLSGFKAITINAAVEIEKTLTAANLTLGKSANLTIGTGATATVKTSLTGVNGAKITLADAYKSFALNGAVNGDKIKLVSKKSLEDKIIFKTKLDLSGKFDVSGIAPTNAGTLKYDLLTNGGNAYLKAFAIDVNGTKYAFWNDAIAAITDKDKDYTITLLADVNIGAAFKLPAKGKFKSFTLNGNGKKLTFIGTSVSLTGNTTFKNITISSVNKKTGEAVAWKLTVGKFDLTKENIDLVSCTVK